MRLLLLCLFWLSVHALNAQVCTIDYTQTSPGIYPDTLPSATVGEFYDTDISFLFPTDTAGFDFTNFQIVNVNAPAGLQWECSNDANGCNYDPQQDPYGCARVWGTPTIPGQYTVAIDVIADLTIQQNNPVTFYVYLEVLPPAQTNAGFTMSPGIGCGETTVSFTNNNPSGNYVPIPNITQGFIYSWDFDNGNLSNQENPVDQTYTATGEYIIDYSCLIDTFGFFLEGITLNSVNCTDAIGYGNPDLYVIVYDGGGNVVYENESSADDNDLPVSFTMNVPLTNPPYNVQVWDDDADNLFGTADENCVDNSEGSGALVTLSLPAIDAYGVTSQVGSNGSLNFTYDINKPTIEILVSDTLNVYGTPPIPVVNSDLNIPELSTPDLGYDYQWYQDGNALQGETGTTLTLTSNGDYWVSATDTNGCSSISDVFTYNNASLSAFDLSEVNIYPNPTEGNLIVELGDTEVSEIVVSDMLGRTLELISTGKNNSVQIDLTSYNAGVYMVTFNTANGTLGSRKIYKK